MWMRRANSLRYPKREEEGDTLMPNLQSLVQNRNSNLPAPNATPRLNFVSALAFLAPVGFGALSSLITLKPFGIIIGVLLGLLLAQSPKIAKQWERAVVLRLGKFVGLRGPGLFWIIPFVDSVSTWIDQRVITTGFAAEETLTMDTVPVNVDAVLFWMVYDPEKAALEVQNYPQAVSWAAQTALRDIIGRTSLSDLLRGRERIEDELQKLIDERSNPWGVTVQSVEMRDVIIPAALQDAMSREAQAAREKAARVILAEAEVEIAARFSLAAESYRDNPTALHLRAMNMLYEGLKEKGALMLVPSSAVESMGMGGLIGAAALRQQTLTGSKETPE
jgi:regulator of protease activity HflC (stomatin/prohibitin superfamily)